MAQPLAAKQILLGLGSLWEPCSPWRARLAFLPQARPRVSVRHCRSDTLSRTLGTLCLLCTMRLELARAPGRQPLLLRVWQVSLSSPLSFFIPLRFLPLSQVWSMGSGLPTRIGQSLWICWGIQCFVALLGFRDLSRDLPQVG